MNTPKEAEGPLLDLVSRVADGDEPNWTQALEETPDPADRRVIESLRVIGALARASRQEESQTPQPSQDPGSSEGPTLHPGQRLGPYEVIERIGLGGMGEVYRARQTQLDREVAIKTLPWRAQVSLDSRRRFEREARLAASLSHRNIVAIHDFCEHDGIAFVVQEFLEGSSWRSLLRSSGPREVKTIIRMIGDAAAGVAAAHAVGLIHRDIKPDNLLETASGETKVVDFGLARALPSATAPDPEMSASRSSSLFGTPTYSAPECLRGEPADQRSDVFALACSAYELVTGSSPFRRENAGDTIVALLKEAPTPLGAVVSGVPATLAGLIDLGLSKDPARRPKADDLMNAARAAVPLVAGPLRRVVPAKPWTRLALLAAVLLLALAAAWYGTRTADRAPLSIAVTSFDTSSLPRDLEYVGVALGEALNRSLSHSARLAVVSRFLIGQPKKADPLATGRTLGAERVVSGALTSERAGLTATVRILRTDTGAREWEAQVTGSAADLPAFEAAVGEKVREALDVRGPDGKTAPATARAFNPEALRLCAEARYNWFRRTPKELFRSIDLFTRALTLEPDLALAHAGLSRSYVDMAIYVNGVSSRETRVVARRAALRALEIDPNFASGLTALGDVESGEWNKVRAHELYQRAMSLDPTNPDAYVGDAIDVLMPLGRFKEARELLRRGLGYDVSSLLREALGRISYFERDYTRAHREFSEILDVDPEFVSARYRLGQVLVAQGQLQKALIELRTADRQTNGLPKGRALLSYALAAAGQREEAEATLRGIIEQRETEYVPASLIALAYTGLGQPDRAFEWLHTGCIERAEWMHHAAIEPMLDPLRKDPRFEGVLRCVGLVPPPAIGP